MISDAKGPVRRAEQQLQRLHPGENAVEDAVEWARGILAESGHDPAAAPLRALRRLRREDRRLHLATARYLVERAAGRVPSTERRDPPPHLH